MITVESKKKKQEGIREEYPGAVLHDVTGKAKESFAESEPFNHRTT